MIWDEPLDELLQEYAWYLEQLRNHVHRAAEGRQALLIALR
jgi:hypothetical protein